MTDNELAVAQSIQYLNRNIIPKELDDAHGYLLANGYYNYQEYINHLAEKAQDGDSESLEACLYYFGWRGEGAPEEILGYYYYQLTSGAIDINRTDSLAFLRLFSKEDEREVLKGNRNSYRKADLATYKMEGISNRLLQYKTKKEILSDLVDLLLDRIIKYRQGERTLRKYIYDMYYLYVGEYVQRTFRSRDYMKIQYARADKDIENIEDLGTSFPVRHKSSDVLYEWEKEKGDLGVFWINGHTHPLFNELSRTERMILRDNYFYGIPERTLAQKYSVSRDVIKRLKRTGKTKLQTALQEQDVWLTEQNGYDTLYNPN